MIIFSLTFSLALHSLAYEEVHALALDQVLAPERESNEEVMWSGICFRTKRTAFVSHIEKHRKQKHTATQIQKKVSSE
jgi:hypothetical protein